MAPSPGFPGYLYLGQPGVNATSIDNVEVDWDRVLPAIDTTLRVAVFARRTDNILINPYENTPSGDGALIGGLEEQRVIAANVGYSMALGGEIGLRGQTASGFRWKASYSFISITDHLSINQNGIFSPQDFQHGTPTHAVMLGAGYSVDRWELDMTARWQSWFLDYRADPTQSQLQPVKIGNGLTATTRIGYRMTDNVTVALSAQQFNVSHMLVSAGPPVDRRIFLSLTAHF